MHNCRNRREHIAQCSELKVTMIGKLPKSRAKTSVPVLAYNLQATGRMPNMREYLRNKVPLSEG